MRGRDWIRVIAARWAGLGYGLALALPLVASAVLGIVWLQERGWLLGFAGASVGIIALLRLAVWLAPARPATPPLPALLTPPADWTDAELAALAAARRRIARRLDGPLPWADLPAEGMAVIETVAAELSGGKRGALDFTLPEALLLIDRVALRYREVLRARLPVADRVSVGALVWLWRRQGQARAAWNTGFLIWRGVRLVMNPAAAALREVERWLGGKLTDRLGDSAQREAQALLLDEAARAAVELYSGRLRRD